VHECICHWDRSALESNSLLVSSLKEPSHGFTGVGIEFLLSQFLLFIIPQLSVGRPEAAL
jgi:hypothetical protein